MSNYSFDPWRHLLNGIDHATGSAQTASSVPVPRQQNVNVPRIDL
jgi:hypothetical protein